MNRDFHRWLATRMCLALCCAILSLAASPARSETASPKDFAAQCESVAEADFSQSLEAPIKIASTVFKQQGAECVLRGFVSPEIGFELRLPERWSGRFLEIGCSGWCGVVETAACDVALLRGYACIASDMGHQGSDTQWATNNVGAQTDFAFRATHVVALAGKALITSVYGKPPRRSYFMGCSTGGRQGLIEAQRFPWDFDGIVAGAPPMNLALPTQTWLIFAFQDSKGDPLFSADDIRFVHKDVLDQCDALDGLRDGVISNPLSCHVKPSRLLCWEAKQANCLLPAQVAALVKIYGGPAIAGGEAAHWNIGGLMPGSELAWLGPHVPLNKPKIPIKAILNEFYRDLVWPYASAPIDVSAMDFNQLYKATGFFEALQAPNNPDLRAFSANGGKLIMYQGWNDHLEVPRAPIDYYSTVERVMGGEAATQSFFRLFMIPGMHHCGLGEGPWEADYLSAIEKWVEHDQAPDRLVVHTPSGSGDVPANRPVFPYPSSARYKGNGNPNDPSSFAAERWKGE